MAADDMEAATQIADAMDFTQPVSTYPGPMGKAASLGSLPMIKMLMAHGASVNELSEWLAPVSAISFALEAGNLDAAKFLVENGASSSEPLIYAVRNANDDLFDFALKRVGNVDATDPGGRTALMYASAAGRLDYVQALIKKGADVNASSVAPNIYEWEDTEEAYNSFLEQSKADALSLAIASGSSDTTKYLLAKGAKPSVYALEAALRSGDETLSLELMKRGAVPRDATLVAACRGQLPKEVALLLSKGLNPNAKDFEGKTAVEVAQELDNAEILQVLSDKGARPWSAADNYVQVTEDHVNVRDFPDTKTGKVITQLNRGDVAKVVGVTLFMYPFGSLSDYWYKIEDPAGWVYGAYLAYYQKIGW